MTKKELVELLSQYDDDMLILIPGYESGYDDIGHTELANTFMVLDADWYDGEYQIAMDNSLPDNSILLHAKRRDV